MPLDAVQLLASFDRELSFTAEQGKAVGMVRRILAEPTPLCASCCDACCHAHSYMLGCVLQIRQFVS